MKTEELIKEFHAKIEDGPTISCECCNQLWYKYSVKKSKNLIEINETASMCLIDEGNGYICGTCEKYIKKNKIPPCSIVNGLGFPEKPKNLELHPLEWRLLSPRIPFMKIYAAPRGKQLKIRGNVVNVPANFS